MMAIVREKEKFPLGIRKLRWGRPGTEKNKYRYAVEYCDIAKTKFLASEKCHKKKIKIKKE